MSCSFVAASARFKSVVVLFFAAWTPLHSLSLLSAKQKMSSTAGRGCEDLPTWRTRNLGKARQVRLAQRSLASKARQAHIKKAWFGKQARQVGHAGQARHCRTVHFLARQGKARQGKATFVWHVGKARQGKPDKQLGLGLAGATRTPKMMILMHKLLFPGPLAPHHGRIWRPGGTPRKSGAHAWRVCLKFPSDGVQVPGRRAVPAGHLPAGLGHGGGARQNARVALHRDRDGLCVGGQPPARRHHVLRRRYTFP
eukprot:gene162-biopygen18055